MSLKIFSLLLTTGFLTFSNAAQACTNNVEYAANAEVLDVVKQQGAWPISLEKCNFLRKNNLKLHVKGLAGVADKVSLAWVVVSVASSENIVSTQAVHNTSFDARIVSTSHAQGLLYQGLRTALQDLDVKRAAEEIATSRAMIRK